MTYEERQHYRELRERVESLREELDGDTDVAVTRGQALRLLELVDAALEGTSPERWDRTLEVIVSEVSRRIGGAPVTR